MKLTVSAARALSVNQPGAELVAKNATLVQAPASTLKVMTAYTARRTITDAMLDTTVTITSADVAITGSLAGLQAGDVISYRDLFYGLLLPSGNDAARALARLVGDLIRAAEGSTGDGITRFLAQMSTVATEFHWTGSAFTDPSGLDDGNRLSARHLATVLQVIAATDPFLIGVMGTATRGLTITGANARTQTVTHTIDPNGAVKFPEFVAGKTGTTPLAGAGGVMLWNHPDGTRHVTVILGSTGTDRFPDLRAIIDEVIRSRGRARFIVRGGVKVQVESFVQKSGVLVPLST